MFVRELFGFQRPRVWVEAGYDTDQDVVFLKVGRECAALSPREVVELMQGLADCVEMSARSVGL